ALRVTTVNDQGSSPMCTDRNFNDERILKLQSALIIAQRRLNYLPSSALIDPSRVTTASPSIGRRSILDSRIRAPGIHTPIMRRQARQDRDLILYRDGTLRERQQPCPSHSV